MTDELDPDLPVKSGKKANQTSFKSGFDERRWLKGRGKKSPDQRKGEEIALAVIWEELSREFDGASMKPLETPETIDALRLSIRSLIKKKPDEILNRIAGKVTERHELSNPDGSLQPEALKPSEIAARVAALLEAQNKSAK